MMRGQADAEPVTMAAPWCDCRATSTSSAAYHLASIRQNGADKMGAAWLDFRHGQSVPELPDITVYIEAIERRVTGRVLEHPRPRSAFLLRSVEPPLTPATRPPVVGLR